MSVVDTTIDNGSPQIGEGVHSQELLTFASAKTIIAGTILARSSVTAKLVPFVIGGTNGSNLPIAVLNYDVTRTAIGDSAVSALIAGTVIKERLIVDADGDGDNITAAILDQLRAAGVVAVATRQLTR